MKRDVKAVLCIAIGILGLILPMLPGIILIAYGFKELWRIHKWKKK